MIATRVAFVTNRIHIYATHHTDHLCVGDLSIYIIRTVMAQAQASDDRDPNGLNSHIKVSKFWIKTIISKYHYYIYIPHLLSRGKCFVFRVIFVTEVVWKS